MTLVYTFHGHACFTLAAGGLAVVSVTNVIGLLLFRPH